MFNRKVNKFQDGGQAGQQQMMAKIQQDLTKAVEEIKNQTPGEGCQAVAQYPDDIVQALTQQNPQIGEIIQAAKQLVGQSTISAKLGSKLAYIKYLKNECPEGQELVYYHANGGVCKACIAKKQKCGGKTTKKACGGVTKKQACGGKTPKKACGSKLK